MVRRSPRIAGLLACLSLLAGTLIAMRTTLQYVAPGTSFVGNTNMQTDIVRQSLRGCRQQMRWKGLPTDDALGSAQEEFQKLPEFAQGSVAGALATFTIASAPALGGVGMASALIYGMLDERAKGDAQRALQKAFKPPSHDDEPQPQHHPVVESSALNDLLPVSSGVAVGNIPTFEEDYEPWPQAAEVEQPSGYHIGQKVEVMRSDKTWSKCEISELRTDGTIIVSISGTKQMKAIKKSGISKYIRGMEANPDAYPQDEGPYFNQPDVQHDSRQIALSGENNVMAKQHISHSNMQHDGQVGNRQHIVGQMVEVLRSDQSWSRASVIDVKGDGTVVVKIEGVRAIKTITSNNIDGFLRASQERELQVEPGKLGMGIDEETAQITGLMPGGQAEALGMQPGWQMVRINDKPFDLSTFYEHAGGSLPYVITFKATGVHAGPPSGNNVGDDLVAPQIHSSLHEKMASERHNEKMIIPSYTPAAPAQIPADMVAPMGSSAEHNHDHVSAAILPSASGALDVPGRDEWPRLGLGLSVGSTALSMAGGGVGFAVGSAAGGIAGASAAPFTLGLSVPAGAAFGGSVGAIAGTLEGGTVGAVLSSAVQNQLRGAKRKARQITAV